ncbi:hypothetical protein Asp14428_60190 [Actinoplanes sp. NBRC 14428]|uniref:Uncharacterized protein n=1 Tax=Pseudosporangium ferrugineum TaxID=439699 RepID=A0A2T0SD06_9ACTN|nr:DUF6232 family protein [Pseudosporangium ferrugineum]PRY31319.1 hypothetical protein CLV70_103205 [Pseudosporangium ferrugineum]BCJ54544.1 hypothetical protein Asp14428_60190 [Actinoplanes sp. NBRC 14428]
MVTYYRDRDVRVTSGGVRIGGHDYRLDDFAQVWHERGRRQWKAVAGRGALGLAMMTPLVVGALGVLVALVIDASVATTIALVGGSVLIGLAAAPLADVLLEFVDRSYDRGSRRLEIWADVRGARTMLVRTDDAQRFGQIYRALQRALDHHPVSR